MTLSSSINRNDYTGNGAVDTYAYTFKIFVQGSLVVTIANDSSVEFPTLVIGTDYTVTGVGATNGGNVVLVNSSQDWLDGDGDLKTDYKLTIQRVRDITQDTDIRNQGDYFPETHEDRFDKLTMVDQQQQDLLDRAMKLQTTTTGVSTELPAPLADGYLGYNSDGTAFANKTPTSISDSGPNINTGDARKIINVNSAENAYQLSTFKSLLEAVTSGGLSLNTLMSFFKGSDVASTGALTLGDGNIFDITGTTGITSITAKTSGTFVILQFDAIVTVTDGSNLKLQGDFVSAAEKTLALYCDGTNWFEVSRAIDRTKIEDADQNTGWEAERTSDDNILYAKTAGTDRMVIDASGNMIMPTQPSFNVGSAAHTNLATGGVTLVWGTERTDQGGNFAANTFTAPVAGNYYLSVIIALENVDQASNSIRINLITSNFTYLTRFDPGQLAGDPATWTLNLSVIADMDANDTVTVQYLQTAGTAQTDITVNEAIFSGSLIN